MPRARPGGADEPVRLIRARLATRLALGALGLTACENTRSTREPPSAAAAPTTATSAAAASAPPRDAERADAAADATATRVNAGAAPAGAPAVTEATASRVLFGSSVPVEAAACATEAGRIACWLGVRYASDPEAKRLALDLYTRFGTVVGQGEAETMDGAYRGKIRLVPTLPTGSDRRHLVWLHAALDGIDRFLKALEARAPSAAAAHPLRYRAAPLVVKFVRSLDGRTTPSGYALDWQYSYNVVGSLNVSAEGVLALAVHEIFHLNDTAAGAHAGRSWSSGALGADVHAILAKCGVTTAATAARSTSCLTPYTPTPLQVRGGTYYAFQPGNDIVLEYAAELATRVFAEQRAALGSGPRPGGRPFKCGPKENGRAWRSIVDEFFGGIDLVPECR